MWSAKDVENNRVMDAGKNSETKEEAIDAVFRWWASDEPPLTDSEMDEIVAEYGKETALKSDAIEFFEHKQPIEADE